MQKFSAPGHPQATGISEAEFRASITRLHHLEKALARVEKQLSEEMGRRKTSEAILQEIRNRSEALERIVNHSHGVVFSWQTKNGLMVTFVTDNVRRFGYTPQDFYTGKVKFTDIIHPDDLRAVTEQVIHYSRNPLAMSFTRSYRIVAADGKIIWIDDRTRIIRDISGKIIRYEGILLDISEAKRNEEELLRHRDHLEDLVQERTTELALAKEKAEEAVKAFRLQHDFFHTLVETIPNPLFYKDSEGRYVGCNVAFERYLGRPRSDIIGKTVFDMAPQDIAARYHEEDQKLFDHPGTQNYTWKIPRADGALRDVIFDKATILDGDGQVVGILGIITDITELEEARKAAEVANEAKSEFLANMSHEIRTPLNGIIGMSGLLRDTDLDPEQYQYAETVVTCGKALLAVINDILDFSKIEAGKLPVDRIDFDLHQVLTELQKIIIFQAALKGLLFQVTVAPDVPTLLKGDPARLGQVLMNLATNAVKFTESGKVTVDVSLKGGTAELATIHFRVSDTGIGISTEHSHRLFQSFSQLDGSLSRKYGGTGLGLAICKKLVTMMGGTIGVTSREHHGSTFWFDVVLEKQVQAPATSDPVPSALSRSLGDKPIRILLAEDNFINQTVALHILKNLGCQVVAVENGRQALDEIQTGEFDLILMDLQMPDMDGLEATQAIREWESRRKSADGGKTTAGKPPQRRIPIIALTAHALIDDRQKCLEAGMDDFLAKPVVPAILAATLNQWLADRADSGKKRLRAQ